MIFRGQRRILACNNNITNDGTGGKIGCAELLGNQVGINVGGLALDPFWGYAHY